MIQNLYRVCYRGWNYSEDNKVICKTEPVTKMIADRILAERMSHKNVVAWIEPVSIDTDNNHYLYDVIFHAEGNSLIYENTTVGIYSTKNNALRALMTHMHQYMAAHPEIDYETYGTHGTWTWDDMHIVYEDGWNRYEWTIKPYKMEIVKES